ncbi:MAG: hypothetical protein Q9209_006957 [Squamulea sp. 1 TL-2023]
MADVISGPATQTTIVVVKLVLMGAFTGDGDCFGRGDDDSTESEPNWSCSSLREQPVLSRFTGMSVVRPFGLPTLGFRRHETIRTATDNPL